MNDTENEAIRFLVKPNPLLYALEFTWRASVAGAIFGLFSGAPLVIFSGWAIVLLVASFFLVLFCFIIASVHALHLTFIVTDNRAIVRFTSSVMTRDEVSIAIETVKHVEIKPRGVRYGSVYLNSGEASFWGSMSTQPLSHGFYGFERFDEFSNIISEQQNSVPNLKSRPHET